MLGSLKELLEEQVKDLYSAETQLVKALPKMAKSAHHDSLRRALESHLEETDVHAERLAEIAELLKIKPSGKVCKAMMGLLEEGKEALDEKGDASVLDIGIIIAAQKVEHYEISGYGSARSVARQLGLQKIVRILEKTLEEERTADEKLSSISLQELLPAAPQEVIQER